MEGGAPQSTEFGGAPQSTEFWIRFPCWNMQCTIKRNKKLFLRQVFSKAEPPQTKIRLAHCKQWVAHQPTPNHQRRQKGRSGSLLFHIRTHGQTFKIRLPPLLGWSSPSHITRWLVKDFGRNEKKTRKKMKAKRKAMGRKGKGNERKWKGSERKIKEIWENEKKKQGSPK